MLRARAMFAVAICWLALGTLPMSAPAQAPATEAAPAEQAPTTIPVAEIALRADALDARLRQIETDLKQIRMAALVLPSVSFVEKLFAE